jgi:hypothetical protein
VIFFDELDLPAFWEDSAFACVHLVREHAFAERVRDADRRGRAAFIVQCADHDRLVFEVDAGACFERGFGGRGLGLFRSAGGGRGVLLLLARNEDGERDA